MDKGGGTKKVKENIEMVDPVSKDDDVVSSVYLSQEAGSTRAGRSSKNAASTVKGGS